MTRHEPDWFYSVFSNIVGVRQLANSLPILQFLSVSCQFGWCDWGITCHYCTYRKVSNISSTKSQTSMILVSPCSCLCPIHWSQVFSREWRCSWSSTDRRCSSHIWVIHNLIAFSGPAYIRGLTVLYLLLSWNQKFMRAVGSGDCTDQL